MSRLVPEKRMDRNGRLVTRHVRAEQRGSGAPGPLPAATVAAPAAGPGPKAQPEQLGLAERSVRVSDNLPSEAIIGQMAWNEARWHSAVFRFEASDSEVYDVVSAVGRPIDALPLLADGVRSAETADEWLGTRRLHTFRANNSDFAHACLERRIPPERLFELADFKDEVLLRDGDQRGVADSIAFRLTALGQRMATDLRGAHVIEDIGRGLIAFDDIKAVGFTRLSTFGKLPSLRAVFRRIAAGEGGWTTQSLRTLIDRAAGEDLTESYWERIGRMCAAASPEQLAAVQSLRFAAVVSEYASSDRGFGLAQVPAFALYVATIGTDATRKVGYPQLRPFFEAQVPADVAREVIASGGDLAAARGIMAGAERGLASGWL